MAHRFCHRLIWHNDIIGYHFITLYGMEHGVDQISVKEETNMGLQREFTKNWID
jgi:hypothetical protein